MKIIPERLQRCQLISAGKPLHSRKKFGSHFRSVSPSPHKSAENSDAVKVYDSKGEVCERGGSMKDKFLNLYGRRGKFVLCQLFLLYGRLRAAFYYLPG